MSRSVCKGHRWAAHVEASVLIRRPAGHGQVPPCSKGARREADYLLTTTSGWERKGFSIYLAALIQVEVGVKFPGRGELANTRRYPWQDAAFDLNDEKVSYPILTHKSVIWLH